jgi:hypothetical protein
MSSSQVGESIRQTNGSWISPVVDRRFLFEDDEREQPHGASQHPPGHAAPILWGVTKNSVTKNSCASGGKRALFG